MVPVIINAMLDGQMVLALVGFVLAGISDGVDGFIARQFNQRSELGAYLDPLADKLLLVSVFVVLGYLAELPNWLVIAIVSRDAMIVGAVMLSAVMGNPVQMHPLFVSKANTVAQIVLAAAVLGELAIAPGLAWIRAGLITLTAVLTGASAAAYLFTWLQHMSGNGAREEDN